ncbi:MAG TPA: 4'-phosphopantetheinyl transferase superfamily protein [Micromonosporaceae bacterium]
MIEELLPESVAAAEAFDDPADAYLFPAEEALLANAVEKRRREFATARHLARRAMAEFGIAPIPLLPGPNREPCWPPGVVGSITHCTGYRAAVVARGRDLATVGIDAEPNEPLPNGVLETIALPQERDWIGELLTTDPGVRWDRLLFTLKESVYKAWFPLARRWLGFEDALITVDVQQATFTARLLVPGPPLPGGGTLTGFTGRWLARSDLLLAAITLPAVCPAEPLPTTIGVPRQPTRSCTFG